ncbi:MAG: hypothetical protein R3240_05960 [Gammaproteobacteria bacterium]|nr:hypothetical protein [Gammaproteobacteria bacterium]
MKNLNFAIFGILVMCSATAYASDCTEMGYEPFLKASTAKQDTDTSSDKVTLPKVDSETYKSKITSKTDRKHSGTINLDKLAYLI